MLAVFTVLLRAIKDVGCEGVWFHGRRCLVAVALHDCLNEKRSRLSLLHSTLVSRFVRSQQGSPGQ